MKILFIGDLHIEEKAIPELMEIFDEIFSYKADMVIQLGDFYQSNKPTPQELEFGTHITSFLKDKYKKVIILSGTGKHDILHGESVVKYLRHLGITIVGQEYELKINDKKILLGHFMTNKSILEYGSHKYTIAQLKKYDLVMLGHQHNPQDITDKIFHLGSVRYQNFNELHDQYKRIAVWEDGKLTFIPLKSPTPMIEICPAEGAEEYDLTDKLEKLEPNTKVRIRLCSFTSFKNSLDILKKYKGRFAEFKLKLDFEKNLVKSSTPAKKKDNLKEIILAEIKKISDREVRELLQSQFED